MHRTPGIGTFFPQKYGFELLQPFKKFKTLQVLQAGEGHFEQTADSDGGLLKCVLEATEDEFGDFVCKAANDPAVKDDGEAK